MTNNGRRLLQDDFLIASNILKELSINQNFARAKQRLRVEAVNGKRFGHLQSSFFYKDLLKTLNCNNKRLMSRR